MLCLRLQKRELLRFETKEEKRVETIIENFITLTQIPHCSHEADTLRDFLVEYARERGYRTEVDSANNILIFKGRPKLCLQAHYDMVCMGKAPQIETYEEGLAQSP